MVSTVLQDPDGQFIGLTVAEDLAFALENDCADQSEMKDKVALWAERLDLTSPLNHPPSRFIRWPKATSQFGWCLD